MERKAIVYFHLGSLIFLIPKEMHRNRRMTGMPRTDLLTKPAIQQITMQITAVRGNRIQDFCLNKGGTTTIPPNGASRIFRKDKANF